jgi:putative spermidine/putrescine transport system ATP-binding protein
MPGLHLDRVGKSFGHVAAVADVSLEFPHGKFVCLLGPSGCGKTNCCG